MRLGSTEPRLMYGGCLFALAPREVPASFAIRLFLLFSFAALTPPVYGVLRFLPPSVHSMTLTASATQRLSIDIPCPQGAQQQTRRPPLLLTIDGVDGRSTIT